MSYRSITNQSSCVSHTNSSNRVIHAHDEKAANRASSVIHVNRVTPPLKIQTPTAQTPIQTPVPTPSGGSSIESMISQAFGAYGPAAIHVAQCESGLNPGASGPVSIGGSRAAGLFQILYPSTWNGTSEAASSPYNAAANIAAAHELFVRDGYSWREWTCQP
ncbi:MAG: hypothetical protein M3Z24_07130 [Chloroflexota bacterium]|nr:hypothetical protein [Chloroflexota bacterium]